MLLDWGPCYEEPRIEGNSIPLCVRLDARAFSRAHLMLLAFSSEALERRRNSECSDGLWWPFWTLRSPFWNLDFGFYQQISKDHLIGFYQQIRASVPGPKHLSVKTGEVCFIHWHVGDISNLWYIPLFFFFFFGNSGNCELSPGPLGKTLFPADKPRPSVSPMSEQAVLMPAVTIPRELYAIWEGSFKSASQIRQST